ncbi:MAG: hypothetical protein H6719_01010 [Sandaracinaceae bacterium]|nr:hypothetical protein [Sandaracinaceae bacterium]
MALTPSHPFASRLSFFTGKGGVGKSTVVAALAVEAQRRGMRPLVVELGHRASMQAVFDVPHIGHAPVEVVEGVHATNVELDRALDDYVRRNVPVRALGDRIARSESLHRFFAAAPAVGEVLTLLRLEQLLEHEWSPILVDLDATGHALMFLGLPSVFDGLVPDGPVRRLLDGFSSLLRDGERSQLHLVTLPSPLPVQETLELHATLEAEHPIRLGTLFVNRVHPPPLDAAHLAQLPSVVATEAAAEDLALLRAACERDVETTRQLARLDAIPMRQVRLPLDPPRRDRATLGRLGRLAALEDAP